LTPADFSRWFVLRASGALLCALLGAAPAAAQSSYDLYNDGKTREALARAHAELNAAMNAENTGRRWEHLMYVAWLEESTGNHKAAFDLASRAWEIAVADGNTFRIGRSLCWLGWSATSLGLYQLALEFYEAAIEQAEAAGGRDKLPAVWGLATQEKGAVLAKMGELDAGAAWIEETTDYARKHGIAVGVAEGGAHLARIALQRGNWQEATERADEALLAAEECGCSAYNTNRARLVRARIALERSRIDPKYRSEAEHRIRSALEQAERVSDKRHVAEARLLLSRVIDDRDLETRIALIHAAAESLHQMESELRGTADGRLGALMIEADQLDLAAFHLESGLSINRELGRKLDAAYILGDLAELDLLANDSSAHLEKWMDSADEAERSGAWPLAAESQERIAEELFRLGFLRLSQHWSEKALHSIEPMLEKAEDGERRKSLEWRTLTLQERIVEIGIELEHSRSVLPGDIRPDAFQ
jgi:tetratricopeptide (TPR) repeat protein